MSDGGVTFCFSAKKGKKMVITISRQNGSGGKYIGEALAQRLHIPVYDSQLINMAAVKGHLDIDKLADSDEISTGGYLDKGSITAGFFKKVTLDDELFSREAEIIRELSKGPDCIIIGRCGNYILREEETLDVYIYASDMEFKIHRKEEYNCLSKDEAKKIIKEKDKIRSMYHQYHTGQVMGDKNHYDLCVNTYALGIETAIDVIATAYERKKESGNAQK